MKTSYDYGRETAREDVAKRGDQCLEMLEFINETNPFSGEEFRRGYREVIEEEIEKQK